MIVFGRGVRVLEDCRGFVRVQARWGSVVKRQERDLAISWVFLYHADQVLLFGIWRAGQSWVVEAQSCEWNGARDLRWARFRFVTPKRRRCVCPTSCGCTSCLAVLWVHHETNPERKGFRWTCTNCTASDLSIGGVLFQPD